MNKTLRLKFIAAPFLVFIIVSCMALLLENWLGERHIDNTVVMGANALLFLLTAVTLIMQMNALASKNPNVFVRSIMAGTFIKLMAILAAVVVYLVAAGKSKSIGAVITGLGLYIVYTFFEVRISLQLNRLKNGGN